MIDFLVISFSVAGGAIIGAILHARCGMPVATIETHSLREDRNNLLLKHAKTDEALWRASSFCAREHGGDEAAWYEHFLGERK